LESVGRKPEALRLAAAAILPQSAQDTLDLLQAYSSLGMADESVGLIQRSLPKFGTDPSSAGIKLWMASVNTLVEAHRWDDLSSLALGMRDAGENTAVLTGVNRFAEGRVLMARGHEESAESFFHEAARLAWPEPAFALQAATAMLRLNQPHPALEMLVRFEEPLHTNAVYWQTVFETAYALKEDSALLLKAASLARDLKPTDTATRANYAAALLINRQSADEASKITLTFLQSNPNSLVAKVNHSFALAMNRRGDEATTLLRTLDPTRLGDLELSVYHLCWLEIESQRQDWPACQTHIGKINRKFLFPSQIRWLDDVHGQATSTR
jgi:tetratricopeptide (TPR) repeat protein